MRITLTSGAGFSAATDNQLRQYARLSATPDHKNIVGLLFDEVHIKFLTKILAIWLVLWTWGMSIMTFYGTLIQRQIVIVACLWPSQ